MITVTTRGEINTAFLLLGYMPQPTNAFGQTLVDSNERVLLRNTILSGQVSSQSPLKIPQVTKTEFLL